MRISNHHLAVDIAPLGAELQSIVTPDGADWLWDGDPKWWTGRAPLLFPVVGKSPGGQVGITGRTVWLDLNNDGIQDSTEPTALTGKNGVFEFDNLAAGTYYVREILPDGSIQTSPAAGAALSAKLTDGQVKSGQYFTVTTA